MDDSKRMSTPMSTTTGRGRRQRARGPEGVPEHDWLPLVLDGDKVGHTIQYVSVRSFSGVAEDVALTCRQADL
jgi:hypothetical protein